MTSNGPGQIPKQARYPAAVFPLLVALSLLLASCTQAPAAGGNAATPLPTSSPSAAATPTSAPATAAASPASAIAPSPTATATVAPSEVPTSEAFVAAEAKRHVVRLASEIGSRPVGSAAGDQAADYIAAQLESFGYDVTRQAFTYRDSREAIVRLAVEEPEVTSLDALALDGSAAATVRGPVVAAGLGGPADISAAGVAGNLVLVQRGEIPFGEKAANAAAAGALGVIIANNEPGLFRGDLGLDVGIPVVAISQADGAALRERLERGEVIASLAVGALPEEGQAQNVIATLPGDRPGTVIIGGHYDSVSRGPGANDNASGVGTVLEIARVLARNGYPYTIKVIAFGAEEIGLVGSRFYVSALAPEERADVVAMLNLDMVGVGDELIVGGSDELVEIARSEASAMGLTAGDLPARLGRSSDHASFISAGVPAVFLHWLDDPNYHSPEDRAVHVREELLGYTGDLALAILERLAGP